MTTSNQYFNLALSAQGRGFSIIPFSVEESAKRPATGGSWKPFQRRAATPRELKDWKAERDPSHWGVVTGSVSGVIVLDFDGPQGAELLRRLGLTPHVRTPSGGHHVYVDHPGSRVRTVGWRTTPYLAAAFPGLDVRGDGGCAVLIGPGYDILVDHLAPLPLAELPATLQDALCGPRQRSRRFATDAGAEGRSEAPATSQAIVSVEGDGRASLDGLTAAALGSVGHGRNQAGLVFVRSALEAGYSRLEVEARTEDFAEAAVLIQPLNSAGEPEPYTAAEFRDTVESVYRGRDRLLAKAGAVLARIRALELRGTTFVCALEFISLMLHTWQEDLYLSRRQLGRRVGVSGRKSIEDALVALQGHDIIRCLHRGSSAPPTGQETYDPGLASTAKWRVLDQPGIGQESVMGVDTSVLACVGHDAFRHGGLGKGCLSTFLLVADEINGAHLDTITEASGFKRRTVKKHIRQLVAHGILSQEGDTLRVRPNLECNLDRVAQALATGGEGEQQRARHAAERRAWETGLREHRLRSLSSGSPNSEVTYETQTVNLTDQVGESPQEGRGGVGLRQVRAGEDHLSDKCCSRAGRIASERSATAAMGA